MSACEKCWADAYYPSTHNGLSQYENYLKLLEARKDNPCTPEEQRGWRPDEKHPTKAKESKP